MPPLRALSDRELVEQITRLERLVDSLSTGTTTVAANLHRNYQAALLEAKAERTRRLKDRTSAGSPS